MTERAKLLAKLLLGESDAPRYWEALGRFMAAFALVEEHMQYALWRCVGIERPIAPAIFSGTRAKAAGDYIGRIADAKGWDKTAMNDVFGQLGQINSFRNDLIHYGAKPSGGGEWRVSTQLAAHIEGRAREHNASPDRLDDATSDLYKIALHLTMIPEYPNHRQHVPESILEVLDASWRYKPSVQTGK